jgi:preprotein translocase subunit SecG
VHIAFNILVGVEVLLGAILVALVLLHAPKGEGLGAIGGAATVFTGKRGAEAGLDRLTWIVALLFMLVCLVLGFGIIRP